MKQYKTEAVILDTTDVFDADRLFLLLTREVGKLRARARGVRRPTSKLTGHLLSYIPTILELHESGGWFLITDAHIKPGYAKRPVYPENPVLFLQQASLLAEAINRLLIDQEPHPSIYDGLVYTLERLRDLCAEAPAKAQLAVAEFLIKALAELGYQPELFNCVVTGEGVKEEFLAWNSRLGGVMNEEGYSQSRGEGFKFNSSKTLIVLRQFLQPQFFAERLSMSDEVLDEVTKVVNHYIQTQLGQPLKSIG